MRAADGTPCPMHRDSQHGHERSSDMCSMRGTCTGPMAALLTQLANLGILAQPLSVLPAPEATGTISATRENPIGRFTPPDTPPPRT